MAHVLAKDLREAVLQTAIQGRLTEHLESDTPIEVTLKEINEEKKRLIRDKKAKSGKPLPEIGENEMPFDIPEKWVYARLGNYTSIKSGDGLTSKNFIDGPYPVYGGNGITGYHNKANTKKGTLLIGRVGFYCGSVHETINDSWVTDNALIVNYDKCFFKDYLKLLLEALNLGKNTNQTAQPVVTGKLIKPKVIPLPPIEEQARIVAKVDEIMAKIDEYEKLENQLVKLKEQFPQDMKDSLLQAGMTGELTNCQPNSTESYSNVFEISGGSQPSKSYFVEAPQEGYVQLYQTRDYGNKPIPVYIPDKFATKKTKEGDILLARYGGSLGKVFIAHDGAYNVAMAKVIQINPGTFLNRFVYYYHLSSEYQDFCRKVSNGRSAQAGFNKDDIATLSVNIFSIEEQQRIVDKLDEVLPLVDKLAELN